MHIEIEKIVYPGRSLARQDKKVILTDEGLPGELIDVAVIKEKTNYAEARTVSVIKPSEFRATPRCAHYKICSPYQYIAYECQQKIKKDQLKEILERALGSAPDIAFKGAPKIYGYRNKIKLAILWKNGTANYAYHETESHYTFNEIDKCFLASDNANRLLEKIKQILERTGLSSISAVTLRENPSTGELLAGLHGNSTTAIKRHAASFHALQGEFPALSMVFIDIPTKSERPIFGKDNIVYTILGKYFETGIQSFFQVNIEMFESLLLDIKAQLSAEHFEKIIDIYSGVGVFGIIFAEQAGSVDCVEIDLDNIVRLKRNITLNKCGNISLHMQDCSKPSKLIWPSDALAIVDPPRRGLDNMVMDLLLKKLPRKIVYVSCDPVTLSRDIKKLQAKYDLERIAAYDFFPNTVHFETVATLKLR